LGEQPHPGPAHDREQAVADHAVCQHEQEQVGSGGDERAVPLTAEDQRQHRGHEHERHQLGDAHILGPREERSPSGQVDEAERTEEDRQPPERCRQVGEQRPAEVDRAEHLADEDECEERRRTCPERQPGPAEAALIGVEVGHACI